MSKNTLSAEKLARSVLGLKLSDAQAWITEFGFNSVVTKNDGAEVPNSSSGSSNTRVQLHVSKGLVASTQVG